MQLKYFKHFKCFLILKILLLVLASNTYAVVVPASWSYIPKNSDLKSGDSFRLLFVTSETTAATEADITYYNTFVQRIARNNATLTAFADEFRVLGSTRDTNALSNTNTNINRESIPIYWLDGRKVADDYIKFYNRRWDNFSNWSNENGLLTTSRVWTGSESSGARNNNERYLGTNTSNVIYGINSDRNEISGPIQGAAKTNLYPLYGLSPVFNISISVSTYTISTLTLNGANPDFVKQRFNYQDPSASATAVDNSDVSADVKSSVLNTNVPGRYQIIYSVVDTQGSSKSISRTVYVTSNNLLDIDNNGQIRANSDGLMIRHYLQGNRDKNFIKRLIGKNAPIDNPTDILAYLNLIAATKIFDIDNSKKADDKDAIIILKYLIGVRGNALTRGLNLTGTRTLSASITNYLKSGLMLPIWRQVLPNDARNNITHRWIARNDHRSVVFKKQMWVLGGTRVSSLNDIWSSTDGKIWTQASPTGEIWSGRVQHTAVVFKNKMWVLGGNSGGFKNDIWSSSDGATWTQASPTGEIWSGRRGHSSVVFRDKIWVLGGHDSNFLNDVWSSTNGTTWTQVASPTTAANRWSGRLFHSSVVFKNQIWVIGGNSGSFENDVWFSENGKDWQQATKTTPLWLPRLRHSSVVFRDKIYLLGGNFSGVSSGNLNDVWSSEDGVHWQQEANPEWIARDNHSSVVLNDKIWLLGGDGNDGNARNDVWSFGN